MFSELNVHEAAEFCDEFFFLRYNTTSLKVVHLTPDEVIGFFSPPHN
jgi:hypothetical protein